MFVSISHLIKPPYQTLHKKKHPIGSGKERTITKDQPPTKRQQPNAQIGAKHPIGSGKERTIMKDQPPTKRQQPNAQIGAIKNTKGTCQMWTK
jgi:hypothetical protein